MAITKPDANGITFTPAGVGGVQRILEGKLRESVSITDFYANGVSGVAVVGDSTGVSGNGTDNTLGIQAAVNYAVSTGRSVFIPVGIYRITAPINFAGTNCVVKFYGQSAAQSQIFCDFTSMVLRGALSVDNVNSTNPRAQVEFSNFFLSGVNDPKTCGIYYNWGGYTKLDTVTCQKFYNGIVIANDYHTNLINCATNSNANNGVSVGVLIDGVTGASCNYVTLFKHNAVSNGANGIYITGCRSPSIIGCTAESNSYANVHLDFCLGGVIAGLYMEYVFSLSPSGVNISGAGIYINNSYGISINGVPADSWSDTTGNSKVIQIIDSNGISITGLSVELTPSTIGPVGVFLTGNTYAVSLQGCSIRNCSLGVGIASTGSCYGITLQSCTIASCTTAVSIGADAHVSLQQMQMVSNTNYVVTASSAYCTLDWRQVLPVQVTNSSFGALSLVDLEYVTSVGAINTTKVFKIGSTQTFTFGLSYSDMSAGAVKAIVAPTYAGEKWRVVNIITVGSIAFAGAGGNRNILISDNGSGQFFSVLPSAYITAAPVTAMLGSANVTLAGNIANPSTAGSAFSASYQGGTTDYTSGLISITIVAQRVA